MTQLTCPTVVSTFAGGGGSTLGYTMSGFRELLAVEIDKHACACLRANFPDTVVHEGDIDALSVDEVLARTGLGVGELTVLDGSPPCQGFSTAGTRLMNDPRSKLFRSFVRLAEGLRPMAIVMENVPGMVRGDMKATFAVILSELRTAGYNTRAWVVNAAAYGVPQARERLIFIGFRDDLGITPTPPTASHAQSQVIAGRHVVTGNLSPFVTMSDVLELVSDIFFTHGDYAGAVTRRDKPSPTILKSSFGGVFARCTATVDHTRATPGVSYDHLLRSGTRAGRPRDLNKLLSAPPPTGVVYPPGGYDPRTVIPGSAIKDEADILHRLGLPENTPIRRLAVGEIMRLQSFPDTYIWPEGTTWLGAWARLGNSVPPLLIKAVSRHIRETLGV